MDAGALEVLRSAASAAGQAFSKQVVNSKVRLEVRPCKAANTPTLKRHTDVSKNKPEFLVLA